MTAGQGPRLMLRRLAAALALGLPAPIRKLLEPDVTEG